MECAEIFPRLRDRGIDECTNQPPTLRGDTSSHSARPRCRPPEQADRPPKKTPFIARPIACCTASRAATSTATTAGTTHTCNARTTAASIARCTAGDASTGRAHPETAAAQPPGMTHDALLGRQVAGLHTSTSTD